MNKNNLVSGEGLSLSQAQSVSNLCNQRAIEIDAKLEKVNNYSTTVNICDKTLTTIAAVELPTNVVDLLIEKSSLHAAQAFLMENINAKDNMLKEIKSATADLSTIVLPEKPKLLDPKLLPEVDEKFGKSQLTAAQLNEFYEAEAYASHIGQFIHKGCKLDKLRSELPTIPAINWMEIKTGEKHPVEIKVHHTSEQLLKIHEDLAAIHRKYEQRVNYFKAMIKNKTTEENARIAKLNADAINDAAKINNDLQVEYESAMKKAQEQIKCIRAEFEKQRHEKIKQIASMRIVVDSRFQSVIDIFLPKVSEPKE